MKKPATTLLALLVLGAAFAGLAEAQSGSATLSFPAQSAGSRVVVAEHVQLPEAGFLTIHDSTLLSGDALGSVVGVSELLPAGNHSDVRVTLTRALRGANETLIAMPHRDSNGNGIYDFVSTRGAQDGPFTGGPQANANGVVVAPANVNATASVWARSPQASSGTSVLVDLVDMAQGGFLAVHDSTLLSAQDPFGSVVGVSPFLSAGVHRDVLVPFTFNDSKRNVTGPVVLMPHKDTNGNQAYDFVGTRGAQDGPYPGDAPTFAGQLAIQSVDLQVSQEAGVDLTATSTGGHAVVVPRVFLPEPGFLAIHDSTLVTAQQPFTSVIGVSLRLPAGLHHNVTVPLGPVPGNNKPFTANASDTLVAMPHRDTNNNSAYDFITSQGSQDGPFVGGANASQTFAGNIVIASANVTRSSAVVFEDQASANGRAVVIAMVDLSEGGFVALHDMTLVTRQDPFGSVVGVSTKLPPGLHRNVTVTVGQNVPGANRTGPLNASQTLIAMPHKDTNNNSAYDFVSSRGAQDGPFLGAGGAANVDRARVTTPIVVPPAQTPPATTPPGTTPVGTSPAATSPVATSPVATSPVGTSPAATSPAATSPPATSPAATSPAATSPATTTPEETDDAPGFGVAAMVLALGVALLVLRRRA